MPSTIGHVVDRHLLPEAEPRSRSVVLAEEDDRQFVDAGEVARLVEIALGGAAFAEADQRDLAGLAAVFAA